MAPPTETPELSPSMPLDLASAYAASAARVGSWTAVSAVVFRASPSAFAVLALVRATVGILNYTSLGLGPAMIHALAQTRRASGDGRDLRVLFANGLAVACLTVAVGAIVLVGYLLAFDRIHQVPPGLGRQAVVLAGMIGAGTLLRLASDAPGAVLQTEGRIALDNAFLAMADVLWVAVTYFWTYHDPVLTAAGAGHLVASVTLYIARTAAARRHAELPFAFWRHVEGPTAGALLRFGATVSLAQVADFLYAPTDYFLINRLIDPLAVATYAPAVQVDAGLLLLVTGLASVLLPKSAVAHAAGDAALVRRYYVRGTLAGGAMLLLAALAFWALSPIIFRLWLGNDLPDTRRLLPLVLLHTVLGGSSAVGRSVLLATGKVRAFTASVLIAGAANVVVSYALARFTGLGLYGIVLGTVIVVMARCVVWMPWYVLRTLRHAPVVSPAARS